MNKCFTVCAVLLTAVSIGCSQKNEAPVAPALIEPPASASTPGSAEAQKYEGKIVRQPPADRGKDDGWYLVQNGQRRWITDGTWLEKNGYSPSAVLEISSAEFAAIPEDPNAIQ